MPNSNNKPTLTSLTDIATAFTAYVAIPAVLFYPVGFLSRWLQIYQPYDIKVQTAWHATAVSDKLDVIGQGVLVLIPPLALSILLSFLLGNILHIVRHQVFFGWKQHESASLYQSQGQIWWAAVLPVLMILALFLLALYKIYSCTLLIGAVPYSPSQRSICARSDWPITLWPMLGYFVGCSLGGYLIFRHFRRATDATTPHQEYLQRQRARSYRPGPGSPSPDLLIRAGHAFQRVRETHPLAFIRGLRERWLLWGLAVAYLVSIASVLWLSPFQEEPSLPRVSYNSPDEDGGRDVGLLLSHHADGRWYILHSDVKANPETFEAEGQWDTELLAIPDKVVGHVRFLRADPETVYAHKGESVESRGVPTYYPGDTIRVELDMRDDESGVLSASVSLFQNSEDCHRKDSEPDIEKVRSFRGEAEKGVNTKMLKIEVTNEKVTNKDIPLGKYSCQRIKVTDAASQSHLRTFYRNISFWITKDKEKPELQDVQITK